MSSAVKVFGIHRFTYTCHLVDGVINAILYILYIKSVIGQNFSVVHSSVTQVSKIIYT
jgi:hypothetical protein